MRKISLLTQVQVELHALCNYVPWILYGGQLGLMDYLINKCFVKYYIRQYFLTPDAKHLQAVADKEMYVKCFMQMKNGRNYCANVCVPFSLHPIARLWLRTSIHQPCTIKRWHLLHPHNSSETPQRFPDLLFRASKWVVPINRILAAGPLYSVCKGL